MELAIGLLYILQTLICIQGQVTKLTTGALVTSTAAAATTTDEATNFATFTNGSTSPSNERFAVIFIISTFGAALLGVNIVTAILLVHKRYSKRPKKTMNSADEETQTDYVREQLVDETSIQDGQVSVDIPVRENGSHVDVGSVAEYGGLERDTSVLCDSKVLKNMNSMDAETQTEYDKGQLVDETNIQDGQVSVEIPVRENDSHVDVGSAGEYGKTTTVDIEFRGHSYINLQQQSEPTAHHNDGCIEGDPNDAPAHITECTCVASGDTPVYITRCTSVESSEEETSTVDVELQGHSYTDPGHSEPTAPHNDGYIEHDPNDAPVYITDCTSVTSSEAASSEDEEFEYSYADPQQLNRSTVHSNTEYDNNSSIGWS